LTRKQKDIEKHTSIRVIPIDPSSVLSGTCVYILYIMKEFAGEKRVINQKENKKKRWEILGR
jgi:hypothetical protein